MFTESSVRPFLLSNKIHDYRNTPWKSFRNFGMNLIPARINYKPLCLFAKDNCIDSFGALVGKYNLRTGIHTVSMNSMNRIDAVLVDLSGTIHVDDAAIEGAQTALQRLRSTGVKVKFVTNTTKEPISMLYNRLQSLNFDIKKSEIFTSLTAARNLIEHKNLQPYLLLEESAKEDFSGISEEDPNAVVVGLAPSAFNYDQMNAAFRLILNGAPLIAIHKARYYKQKDGLYLGPGGFVSALEFATDVTAEVVGKPEKAFFYKAIDELQVKPENTIMIGDDARDDVGGAMKAGMMGILVKTGKYRPDDETKLETCPTYIADDFPQAVDYIISCLES